MKTNFKKNISLVFLLVTILFAGNVVQAQPREKQGPPPIPDQKKVGEMLTELATDLVLNEEQTEKITTLFNAHFEELKAQLQKENIARELHGQTMDKLRKDFEDEVKAQLSDEQKELFDTHMKKHDPHKKGRQKPDKQKFIE